MLFWMKFTTTWAKVEMPKQKLGRRSHVQVRYWLLDFMTRGSFWISNVCFRGVSVGVRLLFGGGLLWLNMLLAEQLWALLESFIVIKVWIMLSIANRWIARCYVLGNAKKSLHSIFRFARVVQIHRTLHSWRRIYRQYFRAVWPLRCGTQITLSKND